ncbi:energy-coupling factor ABC transporter ATP-binding protein [Dellaglioa sp. P0083]|uniref:energy-coupling factor ABC transporter ATP-binding protein n=1 Tax=Dellaglioa kimchii TaxID=3344667 RepID=UPI0038D4AF9D
MFSFSDISYGYTDKLSLDAINLSIQKNEFVCLLGPNGSGKSTLFKLLNGLIFPSKGNYIYNGTLINAQFFKNSMSAKKFHQQIGFVFQNSDVQLFNTTVYDEIAFGPRQMGLSEIEVITRVSDCLNLLNIKQLETRTPYHLSGGEKKLVAIASVLSLNPDVLILDEPLTGLTVQAQETIISIIKELHRAGKTIVMSTHNFNQIKNHPTRFIEFSENHTIILDKPAEIVLRDSNLTNHLALM